jgi:hypothetical protein
MRGKILERGVLFKFVMYSHVACTGDMLLYFCALLGYDTNALLYEVVICASEEPTVTSTIWRQQVPPKRC